MCRSHRWIWIKYIQWFILSVLCYLERANEMRGLLCVCVCNYWKMGGKRPEPPSHVVDDFRSGPFGRLSIVCRRAVHHKIVEWSLALDYRYESAMCVCIESYTNLMCADLVIHDAFVCPYMCDVSVVGLPLWLHHRTHITCKRVCLNDECGVHTLRLFASHLLRKYRTLYTPQKRNHLSGVVVAIIAQSPHSCP